MHFGKYRKVDEETFVYDASNEIITPLTPRQQELLAEYIRCSSYHVVKYIQKEKSTLLWRMTGIFFLLYVLLFYIFSPLKWVLTGTAVYDQDGIIVRIYKNWLKHLPY